MPSWTTMADLSTGDLVTEADMDAIRGNLDYVLQPNSDQAKYTGGNISKNDTTWVDLDATNLALSVATNGGHLRVEFNLQWSHDAIGGHCTLGIEVDGVEQGGTDGVYDEETDTAGRLHEANVCHTIIAPSTATHTIKLRVKTNAGNLTIMAGAARPIIFTAVES